MARWKLTAPHYLNVPGTKWEYSEIDRSTGKQVRRQFPVPTLLDPEDPTSWNQRDNFGNGEVIVAHEAGENSRDHVFVGDPTPDMIPLDDEAREITKSFAGKWNHPIESLSGTYSDTLLAGLQSEMAKIASSQNKPAAPAEGFSELLAAMTTMMKQNAELIAALTSRPVSMPAARRA